MIKENEEPKVYQLNGWEVCQIIAESGALAMAAEHKMYVVHPSNIRAMAVELLAKVGVKVSGKEKWKTLQTKFDTTFQAVLEDSKNTK